MIEQLKFTAHHDGDIPNVFESTNLMQARPTYLWRMCDKVIDSIRRLGRVSTKIEPPLLLRLGESIGHDRAIQLAHDLRELSRTLNQSNFSTRDWVDGWRHAISHAETEKRFAP